MKTPRPQEPQEPRRVGISCLNSPDWRERYWRCITTLVPRLAEEPVAVTEEEKESEPPSGA
jgi:hypothetical protein